MVMPRPLTSSASWEISPSSYSPCSHLAESQVAFPAVDGLRAAAVEGSRSAAPKNTSSTRPVSNART